MDTNLATYRAKKPKIWAEKLESRPPRGEKSRFSVAAGSYNLVYNPNTLLMKRPKIAEDPQFYVDNVDDMTTKCYEDPYKH
jgi:hypothetical protein